MKYLVAGIEYESFTAAVAAESMLERERIYREIANTLRPHLDYEDDLFGEVTSMIVDKLFNDYDIKPKRLSK